MLDAVQQRQHKCLRHILRQDSLQCENKTADFITLSHDEVVYIIKC